MPKLVLYCKARDEAEGLHLEESREWGRSSVDLPVSLDCLNGMFTGMLSINF